MKDQWELQKLIVARQTELGIGSVLPAFSGKVPGQLQRLFPHSNISGTGAAGPAWVDALNPLFANISTLFLSKQIRDFGKTGFYEADGFFTQKVAPWYEHVRGASSGLVEAGLGGLPGCVSPYAATPAPGATEDNTSTRSWGAVACVYAAERKNTYIPGDASDEGKHYTTLDGAMKVCSADVLCGGVISFDCDKHDESCKTYQTRSGMSTAGCHAGVPCPGAIPHTLPLPATHPLPQNSYLVTNAKECGHHAAGAGNDDGRIGREHANAVYQIMKKLDPDAVWVYQVRVQYYLIL
jgi:hypothetical protein